jgi:hypothetical protein
MELTEKQVLLLASAIIRKYNKNHFIMGAAVMSSWLENFIKEEIDSKGKN